MPTIEEYKKKGGWYEFPNGEKRQGEEAAQAYLDSVDVDELFEEPEPEPEENVITTDDLPDDEDEEETVEKETATTVQEDNKDFLVKKRNPGVRFEEKGPSGKRYVFTKEHPLVVVRGEDVEHFVSQPEFELATPQQAQEFYS